MGTREILMRKNQKETTNNITFIRLDEEGLKFRLSDGTALVITEFKDHIATISFGGLTTTEAYAKDLDSLMKGIPNFSGLRAICPNISASEHVKMEVNDFIKDYCSGVVSKCDTKFDFKSEEARKKWEELVKENENNEYVTQVINYVQEWGKLMQLALQRGLKIKQIAGQTSNVEIPKYLPANSFKDAIKLMEEYWKYGDEIKKWIEATE